MPQSYITYITYITYVMYVLYEIDVEAIQMKNIPFRWLWTATASGALGEGIALSALPLVMASLTRDPLMVALLQTAAALPWALFGLQAGALADRWDRARVLFTADLVRAALAGALAMIILLGLVRPTFLLLVAFATSSATVMFRAADAALLPSMVTSAELPRANGRLKAAETITGNFIGPGLGAAVFAVSHWAPAILQSVAFALSALCLRRLPRRKEPRPRTGLTLRAEVVEGLRRLWADRTLRALAAATTLQGAGTWMMMAVLVLYSLETLHAAAAFYGVLITAYAAGSLLGTVVSTAAQRRLGARLALTSAALIAGFCVISLSLTRTFAIAATAMFILGVAAMTLSIIAVTLRQQRIPEHLLGRVSAAFGVLNVASAPVVAPISGLIGANFGLPAALAVAGTCICAAAPLLAKGVERPSEPAIDSRPTPL